MSQTFEIITPVDGSVYATRAYHTLEQARAAAARCRAAQRPWAKLPVEERAAHLSRFLEVFLSKSEQHAAELTWQVGRPISQSPGELKGFEARARHMMSRAAEALAPLTPAPQEGFTRELRRVPHGVVLNLPAWNYPLLTAVNAFVPALMAGNGVVIKHSNQSTLCGERIAEELAEAGLPEGLFELLYLDHPTTAELIAGAELDHVCFTGSVAGGRAIQRAASDRFIGVGLELGGCDAAYVRADANLSHAVENLVDGAMFNSGQSCCGIQRVYVAQELFDDFLEGAVALTGQYKLGDPTDPATNLGPVVSAAAAGRVREMVEGARRAGARLHLDPEHFGADDGRSAYLAPQVISGVTHELEVMREECFGPVMCVMPVRGDEEATRLINDSRYGLTAALWTQDEEAAARIAPELEVGTVFMNRCDYLDPALGWAGVKDSGRGCTLSDVGYEALTRPQSVHFRRLG